MIVPLVVILVLLFIAACFEGAETGMFAVSDVRLQTLAQQGDKRALIVIKLKKNVRRLLGTLLLGQTICDIAAASLATLVAHDISGEWAVAIEAALMTVVVLIFVNLIPKSHAAHSPEKWALRAARAVWLLTLVLGPVVKILDRFASLFVPAGASDTHISEEEIRTMAGMGVTLGVVEGGEKELIERVFLFNDITAADVLTPKELMFTLDAAAKLGDVIDLINSQKFSRYPVYADTKDNIIGVVHIKDVFGHMSDPVELTKHVVRDFVSPPVFVSETALIDDLFREFKRKRVHMAIVQNEAGAVVGLVTLEDLLEELVGEIADESDVDENVIKRINKHTVLVHGDTDVPDINRFFNVNIEAGDHRTIGRLVREKAKNVPKQGQPVMVADEVMAVVEQVNRGRIMRVRLIKSASGAVSEGVGHA